MKHWLCIRGALLLLVAAGAAVAAYRFHQKPIRVFAASGTLVVVLFYLIAQMVGAGQLTKLLFGLEYWMAVVIVGVLMMIYVLFGGMTATAWVQIIKAVLLLSGASTMAFAVLAQYGFSPENLFATATEVHARGFSIMGPGNFVKNPISAICFGMALMFGTAGLPHILMRFFTVPSAKEARKSVLWATSWIGYFYILTFIIGFGFGASELRVSKITTIALGFIAVLLGIAFEKQNLAFMVSLAFAIAASANFPVLFMSVLWKNCTTRGHGRRLPRAGHGGHPDSDIEVGLGQGSGPYGGDLPLHLAGDLLDADGHHRHLAVPGAGHQPARGHRQGGFEAQEVRLETGIGASRASGH